MIYELDKADYGRAQPLFRPLSYQPMCTAVLERVYPGRVFVDDLYRPRTAFLNVWENWCFLVGNPENDAFNRALNQAIFYRSGPTMTQPGRGLDWGTAPRLSSISTPRLGGGGPM